MCDFLKFNHNARLPLELPHTGTSVAVLTTNDLRSHAEPIAATNSWTLSSLVAGANPHYRPLFDVLFVVYKMKTLLIAFAFIILWWRNVEELKPIYDALFILVTGFIHFQIVAVWGRVCAGGD